MQMQTCLCHLPAWIAFVCVMSGTNIAPAEPQIKSVTPPGLRVGHATVVTIQGSDLLEAPRIVLGSMVLEQKPVGESRGDRIQLEVVVPDSATPGIQTLRVATTAGISNALTVSLDRLTQLAFTAEVQERPD